MQMQQKKVKGFSVLELMVVIGIIAVISVLSFEPYQKWRSDRIVRSEAANVSSLMRDIYNQVQRGQYSFVQLEIMPGGAGYSISTNGMKIDGFTDLVRDKYDGSTLNPFHNFSQRCGMTFDWDHSGKNDQDVLTVNEIFIDTDDVELGIDGKAELDDTGGFVCFSKDGTYYSTSGIFLEGTGDSATPIEELYICSADSGVPSCTIGADGPDQKNFFKVEWSRFGNISLKKWANNQWILQ